MAIRVLIVDDSGFFRRRLTEIFNSDPMIEVVETAVDGQDAINKAKACRPDVITMDIEMPVMNGIDATRAIMQQAPAPIIMFSSLTYDGAQATLDALEAGAVDFLPKRFDDISNDKAEARKILCSRIKAVATPVRAFTPSPAPAASSSSRINRLSGGATSRPVTSSGAAKKPVSSLQQPEPAAARRTSHKAFNPSDFDIVAIGTSTGGPVALQDVLAQLPSDFSLPLLLVQHMPCKFTEAFAARLNQLCKIEVREAKQGDELKPGLALLAPGGMQMKLEKRGGRLMIRVEEETDPSQNYKPCVDVTFDTVNKALGSRVLAIILTGMGADGRVACNAMKNRGAVIWAQDEASSTIYGMPAAVADIAEQILPLKNIGKKLATNS
ncbi:Chemotaxis response regulator protein-glutamate methylesterase CheB [hydrothermal vent metagenome]|uniref:protein-glutamate methylesterase n=1 Tax=hydrothermal vent metagenome TaxID=652676 RepID=A0A3B0XZR2_9ZZZZ